MLPAGARGIDSDAIRGMDGWMDGWDERRDERVVWADQLLQMQMQFSFVACIFMIDGLKWQLLDLLDHIEFMIIFFSVC